MKGINLFMLLLVACVLANNSSAGQEGGGGDVVILPNGDVVLADVFLDRNQPQPDNMPRRISLNPLLMLQIKKYNEFLRHQLNRVKKVNELGDSHNEILNLFKKLESRDDKIIFYSVKDDKELNTYCASGGTKAYILPNDAKVTQVACTSGDEVFLVEPLFKKMSILQQSLLLMHERMTTLKDQYGGKNYGAIAGVTSGLGEIVNQVYNQQQSRLTKLTPVQQIRIHNFYQGLIELSYRNSNIPSTVMDWKIHQNGGGFLQTEATVDPEAFVGATSVISSGVEVEQGAVLLEATVIGSSIRIGKDSRLVSSTISAENLELGSGSKIDKSILEISNFNSGNGFSMRESNITVRNNNLIALNPNQKILKGFIESNYRNYFYKGQQVNYPQFSLPVTQSLCQESMKEMLKKAKKRTLIGHNCAFDYDFQIPLNPKFSAGVDLKTIFDIETGTYKYEYRRTLYVIRSFQTNLSFSPAISENGSYYIFDQGNILPRGDLKTREIGLPQDVIQTAQIVDALKGAGLRVDADGNSLTVHLNAK
jgi:hypothetical protein